MVARALVLGKFMPLHRGHLALVEYACTKAHQVVVWLCAAEHEPLPGPLRMAWLEASFAQYPKVVCRYFAYREDGPLSSASAASWEVARAWADVIRRELGPIDAVVSSEAYGDYLAQLLGIEHLLFDAQRSQVDISATRIRQQPLLHWQHLPMPVQRYYQAKVCILGTESTGKTTLAQALAQHFGGDWVPERGRALVPDSRQFSFEVLPIILHQHAQQVQQVSDRLAPIVFIDTDHHITQSYALYVFGRALEVPQWIAQTNQADLYLYLAPDVPLVQDGTRFGPDQRLALDASHRRVVQRAGLSCTYIGGTWAQRWQQAKEAIELHFGLSEWAQAAPYRPM